MGKMDEMIMVAPRGDLFAGEAHAFHGFLPVRDPRVEPILRGLCAAPRAMRRGDVEDDPSLKQPIPYVVLLRTSEGGEQEVFTYTRLTGGGETRLHGKVSIGVGGHMNRGFTYETLATVVWEEAARELAEELSFHGAAGEELPPPPARFVGLINDDTGAVQQVHLGLLAVAEVPLGVEVEVRETDRLEGRWEAVAAMHAPDRFARLEEWSQHALAALADPRVSESVPPPRS